MMVCTSAASLAHSSSHELLPTLLLTFYLSFSFIARFLPNFIPHTADCCSSAHILLKLICSLYSIIQLSDSVLAYAHQLLSSGVHYLHSIGGHPSKLHLHARIPETTVRHINTSSPTPHTAASATLKGSITTTRGR